MKLHVLSDSCERFPLKVAFQIHTGMKFLSQIAKLIKASQLSQDSRKVNLSGERGGDLERNT